MSFRKEKKYRVTKSEFHELMNSWLKNNMKPLHINRQVNSIYFDNNEYKMFHDSEEGVLLRKKVRIRWYNKKSEFKLEEKISTIEGRFKTVKSLGYIGSICEALNYRHVDQIYGALEPSLKVSYERSYFLMDKMRITFDNEINYCNLRQNHSIQKRDPETVIEIKTPFGVSDDYIEKTIPYSTSRFSKYSRGLLFLFDQNTIV